MQAARIAIVFGAALGVAAGAFAEASTADAPTVQIDEPRPYGHVIGDVITRSARIELPAGATLDAEALPRPGRVDRWLELRSLATEQRGSTLALRLDYQVINVGAEVTTTVLPALRLPLAGSAQTADLGDWPVHLSPLTTADAVSRGALEAMQPDIVPLPEPLAPIALRLAACLALLAVLALPWLSRRFPQLAFWRRRAPFRSAWRELGALRRRPMNDALAREALQRLHAAFDASAGRAVFADGIEPLYAAQPAFKLAAAQIESFFAASRQRFFGAAPAAAEVSIEGLRALALRLARLERAP